MIINHSFVLSADVLEFSAGGVHAEATWGDCRVAPSPVIHPAGLSKFHITARAAAVSESPPLLQLVTLQ